MNFHGPATESFTYSTGLGATGFVIFPGNATNDGHGDERSVPVRYVTESKVALGSWTMYIPK